MNDKYRCHLFSNTPSYGVAPRFVARSKVPTQGFISLYSVTEETAEALRQTGTTRGFKGIVWSERLWIDVDSYEAADSTESRLREMGYDFIAYDTGGRGAHFGVLRSAQPSHLLPSADRAWVAEHFKEADLCIYTHLHPFRLPGTIHEKTGREKRLVCEYRGSTFTLPLFKERDMQINKTYIGGQGNKSIFDSFGVMFNTIPVKNGERHRTLIKLIYALKDRALVDVNVATWWVREWNKMLEEPKSEEELEKAIRSIYY